ncbi:MAG: hypothetical protein EOP07_18165 [Proteobacteria bacterium]|nr:MAG: hypothetical protein EOP07_18165 [Pseudomonadota bacterium]
MRLKSVRDLSFLSLFIGLSLGACGKKKSDSPASPAPSANIPADWDLNSDYPASDLKAKDL